MQEKISHFLRKKACNYSLNQYNTLMVFDMEFDMALKMNWGLSDSEMFDMLPSASQKIVEEAQHTCDGPLSTFVLTFRAIEEGQHREASATDIAEAIDYLYHVYEDIL